MAEAHLDHPGEITWFKGHQARPVQRFCPHDCPHDQQSVIAWGPGLDRYELVQCLNWPGCSGSCRAWANSRGQVVSPWLQVTRHDLIDARHLRLVVVVWGWADRYRLSDRTPTV